MSSFEVELNAFYVYCTFNKTNNHDKYVNFEWKGGEEEKYDNRQDDKDQVVPEEIFWFFLDN